MKRVLFFLSLGVAGCGGGAASELVAPVPLGRVDPAATATAPRATENAMTFLHRAPQAGDRFVVKTVTHSQSSITDAPPEGEMYSSAYELVVRNVEGDAITEASVFFSRNERAPWNGANDDFNYAPKPTSLAGQHLRIHAEPLGVTRETGAPVSADVAEGALNAISDIGMRNALDAAIADQAYLPGHHADDLAPAIVRVLNPRSWHFLSGSATLQSLDDANGIFHVAIHVHSDSRYDIAFEGNVTVRRRDRVPTEIALRGAYTRDDLHGEMIYVRTIE